jgi:glycosyltransferase involved in cell wall biosynthesis
VTVCACLLVKDEEDVIEYTVRHLLAQVDHVMVVDNLSTDRTREILKRIGGDVRKPGIGTLDVWDDPEPGYYQADKMTAFAQRAHAEGYDWFVPVDADEYWYSPFGRIADVIAGLEEREPQALFLRARMLNHLVTGRDDDPEDEPNPFRRIGYRLAAENALPKIACRTSPALRIGMGNHEATNVGIVHTRKQVAIDGQLVIHHFPWRSEEQFLRKITNGALAYAAAPGLDDSYGEHWRQFGLPGDDWFEERVRDWFRRWGYREDPLAEFDDPLERLIYDPAVL